MDSLDLPPTDATTDQKNIRAPCADDAWSNWECLVLTKKNGRLGFSLSRRFRGETARQTCQRQTYEDTGLLFDAWKLTGSIATDTEGSSAYFIGIVDPKRQLIWDRDDFVMVAWSAVASALDKLHTPQKQTLLHALKLLNPT